MIDTEKCIGCQACVETCPTHAIDFGVIHGEKAGLL